MTKTILFTLFVLINTNLFSQIKETDENNPEHVILFCNDQISALPNDPFYYIVRAKAEYDLKQYKLSSIDIKKAIELDNKDAQSLSYSGLINIELGNFKQALVDFNKAINLNPKNSEYYFNRGYTYSL
jgi:tetratricopeptide (TPR) repeat protein